MPRRVVAVFLLALLTSWGCARPAGRERPPASPRPGGRAATPAAPPRRIISCAPNLTEMLFGLGAGDRLIGVTRYCQFPPEARSLPPLGDLFNPNLEAMVAAQPDLIVFVPGSRKIPEFFARRSGGPRLLETNGCETIAEIQATILELGQTMADTAAAGAIVARQRAGLEELRQRHVNAPGFSYLMVLGHEQGALEQIYVVGQRTYLTELMALIGGHNVVPGSLGRYPLVSREALLEMSPQVVIERHLGPASAQDRQRLIRLWDALPTLPAVRAGAVVVLDDDHVTINGPALVEAAESLGRLVEGLGTAGRPRPDPGGPR